VLGPIAGIFRSEREPTLVTDDSSDPRANADVDSDPDRDVGADLEPDTDPESDADPAVRARVGVLEAHAETVETVLRCADAVAESWDADSTADGDAVAEALRGELEAVGAWARLPDVLAGATRAAGFSLAADPVADPPYVVATSRGPMLRATVSDGRLVVLLQVFAVERDSPQFERDSTRYVRGPTTPADAVRASFE
jgi:hypothetical protein